MLSLMSLMRGLIGVGDEAGDLLPGPGRAAPGEGPGPGIALQPAHAGKIDAAGPEARRGAGLEPPHPEAQFLEMRRQGGAGELPGPARRDAGPPM